LIVEFEDVKYELDTARIRLQHAMAIQLYTGLSIGDWQDSLEFPRDEAGNILNPPPEWLKSVAALYWLMLAQNGRAEPIADVDFDFSGFYGQYVLALGRRWQQIQAERAAAEEADPTQPSPTSPPEDPPSTGPSTPTDTTPPPRARRGAVTAATGS
jgi:hypothetical protein